MSPVSYQTIKLGKGKHSTPEEGACVMELASLLAGEPFTDHPASVCPVIGSFLRSYNDTIDDSRRQALYEYSIDAVGSYAVHSITKHTDRTHASVLALIDELLAIGVCDDRVSARVIAARSRTLDAAA
ncbi:MAG: hypothetical protein ACLP4R_06210 [Solirubrobacteraceae bacterium]